MADGFAAGGRIDISLAVGEGQSARVSIDNRRFFDHGRLLRGLYADEAVRRISQLFSVCRFGQGVAAAEAFETASNMVPNQAQGRARRLLVLTETLLDHASRILLEWPLLHGSPPVVLPLKIIRAALLDLWMFIYPEGDWNRPGGGRLRPLWTEIGTRLSAATAALMEAKLICPVDLAAWDGWLQAASGPAVDLFHALIEGKTDGFGGSGLSFLLARDQALIALSLETDGSIFVARPEIAGEARETGPFARQSMHPLIAALSARHGDGLLVRYAAQLLEISLCLTEMRELSDALCNDNGSQLAYGGEIGMSAVEAARGWLFHRVVLDGGRVTDYQIVAPTEWNFHPQGPLVKGLLSHPCGHGAEKMARLLIGALDPCVETNLMIDRHA